MRDDAQHGHGKELGTISMPQMLSVIGLQNSGKTRFVLSILRTLSEHGLTAAVLKHDGHADMARVNDRMDKGMRRHVLDWEKPGSDTMLAFEAGAAMTLVTGGGQSLLHFADDSDTWDVDKLIKRMLEMAGQSGHPLDAIIVEGFKKSRLPKVFICRNKDHVFWLREHSIEHVRAVIVSEELRNVADPVWPMFDESQVDEVLQACGIRL